MYWLFLFSNTENADTPIDTTTKKNTDMKSMIAALKKEAAAKQGKLILINCQKNCFFYFCCVFYFSVLCANIIRTKSKY